MKSLIALLLSTGVSLANADLPPAEYDVGDLPTEEAMQEAYAMRSPEPVMFFRVPYGQAYRMCDDIRLAMFEIHYPAPREGDTILGCYLDDGYGRQKSVIYSFDDNKPWLSLFVLRHEIGHALNWRHDE